MMKLNAQRISTGVYLRTLSPTSITRWLQTHDTALYPAANNLYGSSYIVPYDCVITGVEIPFGNMMMGEAKHVAVYGPDPAPFDTPTLPPTGLPLVAETANSLGVWGSATYDDHLLQRIPFIKEAAIDGGIYWVVVQSNKAVNNKWYFSGGSFGASEGMTFEGNAPTGMACYRTGDTYFDSFPATLPAMTMTHDCILIYLVVGRLI